MPVASASIVAPGWLRRIVQSSCVISLLVLSGCQDNSGSGSKVSSYSGSPMNTAAGQTARPGNIQWGLLPLSVLPEVDITAARQIAGVTVMRHTKQDRLPPRKLASRLSRQKPSLARVTTRAKTPAQRTRMAAVQTSARRGSFGEDTMLARRPTSSARHSHGTIKPQQKAAKRPQRTARKTKSAPGTNARKGAINAPNTVAALIRPQPGMLSTGSINRNRPAADPSPLKSYLSPIPKSHRYKLAILGDSLGVGIGMGMSRDFVRQGKLDVLKEAKEGSGLARPDFYNWDKALSRVVRRNKIDIAIVEIGANDGQSIRSGGRVRSFGSSAWRREYIKRIDSFIAKLKREHASIYWVGIPPMGRPKLNSQVKLINSVIKDRVQRHGIKFISTWERFANRYGQYTAFGRDRNSKRVQIRAKDGVHFTMEGYRLLAAHVQKVIARDMTIAQQVRKRRFAGRNLCTAQ